MAKKKAETKKQKAPTKSDSKIDKNKNKLLTNKKKLKKALADLSPDSDSDSDSSTSETLQNLLKPYPKDKLIDLLATAAASDAALAGRIIAAADSDVSHRKIFVYGFGWDVTKETLAGVFEGYGEIEDCNVISDRVTGKSKGYGFVLFGSRKGAIKALEEPKKKIGNRVASCQLSSVGAVSSAPTATHQQDGMSAKIYVSNVPTEANPEKLRTFFAKFGEIEAGPLGFDLQTGKSRGFALFVYKTVESARKALQEQYKMFDGHQLRCQKATENKHKDVVGGAATITMAVQPVQQVPVLAAMAAAQNMAMMSQQQFPGLNPLYNGLLTNPMMAAQGYVGPGQMGAGYGAAMPGQLGSLGGNLNSSLLGTFGASGSGKVGLQQSYLGSSGSTPGAAGGGSFSGLTTPSYKR